MCVGCITTCWFQNEYKNYRLNKEYCLAGRCRDQSAICAARKTCCSARHIAELHHQILQIMWTLQENKLYRKFQFANFSEAFAFMTRVAIEAEKANHHPYWSNVWNTVEIWLNTHDAGDVVTEKDHQLAAAIDALLA
jgi:4a-hydroxytetrahydrobiopterin dehydratase